MQGCMLTPFCFLCSYTEFGLSQLQGIQLLLSNDNIKALTYGFLSIIFSGHEIINSGIRIYTIQRVQKQCNFFTNKSRLGWTLAWSQMLLLYLPHIEMKTSILFHKSVKAYFLKNKPGVLLLLWCCDDPFKLFVWAAGKIYIFNSQLDNRNKSVPLYEDHNTQLEKRIKGLLKIQKPRPCQSHPLPRWPCSSPDPSSSTFDQHIDRTSDPDPS